LSRIKTKENIESTEEYQEIDLLRLLRAFWHRAWLIIIAAAICGAAGFTYARFFIAPTYKASTLLYVNNGSLSLGGATFSVSDLTASKSLVPTYIVLLKTRDTLNEVIERADLKMSYGSLSGKVSASAVDDTQVFSVNVTDSDPERATLIANTIAEVLPERVEAIISQSSVRIVDRAVVPSGRSGPDITKYTTMGMIIGAVLACAAIVIMELLDDRVRDEQFLIQNYNLPVLATIPDFTGSGKSSYYYSRRRRYGYYRHYGSYYDQAGRNAVEQALEEAVGNGTEDNTSEQATEEDKK
jgi:capsular polysaccharide biosynthesis protein